MTVITSPNPNESSPAPAPGTRLTLRIADIAFGGEGVARTGNCVVFVPFVLLDELVEVEVTELKRNFARARLLRVVEPSAERIPPPCPYFGDCGGCQYQHLAYPAQLRLKHKQVVDLLERIGGFSGVTVDPVAPCPRPYGYRNRIMVRSQWDKTRQALNIGYIRHDNRLVVDVEQCLIAEPALNEALRETRAKPPPHGGIKVTLRIDPENWEVPPHSFFQNNFHGAPLLVQSARASLAASGSRYLIDAYCGVGFFGIELGDLVERFVGIESDPAAIRAAVQNAQRHSRTNGEFICGSTEQWLGPIAQRFPAETTTICIDPPRRGCAPETVEALREYGARQILYVSCEPDTLARDLKVLCAGDRYQLHRVVPVDMFPQTRHIEVVTELRLGPGNSSASVDAEVSTH